MNTQSINSHSLIKLCTAVLLTLSFLACRKDNIKPDPGELKYYLHLSHTRTNSNPSMDSLVEKIDFSKYDLLCLGGDLAFLTSEDDATMDYVDSIYNIRDENTLWALGNHDYSDLDKVEEYTNRLPYYAVHRNDITFVVLDTQDSLSNIIGDQKDFLFGVLDTLAASTHLILLHHKLIWMYDNPVLEPQISSVSNGVLGTCFYCINPNNFNAEIYPRLVETSKKGIGVFCIGGDIGFQTKEFIHVTPEGIHFLASGIKSNTKHNQALLLEHNVSQQYLNLSFKRLEDL